MTQPKGKVYISGPITGHEDTYETAFSAAAELVERAGLVPLNPSILPQGMERGDYMRIALAMVDASNMVLLLDGYEHSDGEQLEISYARNTGKPYLDVPQFKKRYNIDQQPERPKTISRVERMFGSRETWHKANNRPTQQEEGVAQNQSDGYKGFLLLCCPKCGKIWGFCARGRLTEAVCRDCGETIRLKDLVPAYVNCAKCGAHYKYKTNINTHDPIPYFCLGCKAPVDLQMNVRGTALVTMGSKCPAGGQDDPSPFGAKKPYWITPGR